MDRRELLATVSLEAGTVLAEHFGKGVHIDKKGELDLVTVADKEAERLIVDAVTTYFPSDAVIAEEGGRREGNSGWQWIIDPLDGTTNFAHNFPHFSVSMALARDGEVVAGVVYDPIKEEFFTAHKGEGATLNRQPLSVGNCSRIGDALAVTGFSYDRRKRMGQMLDRVEHILSNCQGLRRLGSAALDLAYVAAGRFDLFYEDGLNSWDIAAGSLLVTEAGGRAVDFGARTLDLHAGQIIACNADLLPQVEQLLLPAT
ncbi:MAG: inositol monophosphatase family protein [Acidobacteriota bacterium]|nr:inositol monophosphatase family protein [Acidobacteriota bacterium]